MRIRETMCLLLFYVNPDAKTGELYLILASVRDEIYNRPTKLAEFWENFPNVIGGRDMEPGKEGGTWLAMSKTGKIAALLNILQPDEEILPNKKGRGFLVVDYVADDKDSISYLKDICSQGEDYNEFFLVTMDYSSRNMPKICCYSNHYSSSQPILIEPGVHAFGNSINPLEIYWPKVLEAKKKFSQIINGKTSVATKDTLVEDLFSLLRDNTRYPVDDMMRKQGKGKTRDFLEKLNSIFVSIPGANYGSRCHTVITIDAEGNVDYFERNRPEILSEVDDQWVSNNQSFKLLW
nr:transport and Golgi organization 2 homolog isoform X2 [Parasteatoda tepidariorum]